MSQPYKRPCAETSTQFERDQARIIDELVRETQHMAVNPNNDVQTMELAGGLEAEVLPKDPAPKWPEHELPNLDHYTAFQAYITQAEGKRA
ncbi:hypothetical protein OF83DRAFT_1170414 [Amylostereum chailletii]|nr:hypothetical protein OF83DRAFT_1170414 [Amylostereum chailletii]